MKNKNISLLDALKKSGANIDENQEKFIKALDQAIEDREANNEESYSESFKSALAEATKALSDKDGNVIYIAKALKEVEDKIVSKAQFEELKEDLRILKENPNKGNKIPENVFVAIEKGLEEFIPKLKQKISEKQGETPWELSLEVKAPVVMTTSNTATNAPSTTTPIAYVYQNVTEYAEDVRPEEYIINYLDNGSTNKPALAYMDKLPTEGTMAITAEGALKPLISISFQLRYSQAQKIAGRTKVSEEALDDIPNLMAIIRNELMYEHRIAEQGAILTFIDGFAPAFVAGDMAGSTDVPSNYDAIRAAIYAVKIQSNNRYIPNAVFVKSADVYNMGATKDTLGQYVFPPFVLPDGTRVAGVRVVEVADDSIEDGTFIVGDFRKIRRRVYKSFSVRIGQGIQMNATAANIVSDFESNMYTMIGESRLHLWVYENEKVAFVKDTFAVVKEAIESTTP